MLRIDISMNSSVKYEFYALNRSVSKYTVYCAVLLIAFQCDFQSYISITFAFGECMDIWFPEFNDSGKGTVPAEEEPYFHQLAALLYTGAYIIFYLMHR